jgi:ribonuclease BN (tRNA processing enzyme)
MSVREEPSTLTLTVLGCSGTYADVDNACSSYLLRTDTTTVLLDLGPGALSEAQRHVELVDVDAIVLTHEHPDHWTDLPVARNAFKYVFDRSGLPVYATAGTIELAAPFCDDGTFAWTTLTEASAVTIGDLSLRFSRTDHPVETLAVWVESGAASLLYSADTGPDWWPTAFDARPDVALFEATFEHEPSYQVHLTAAQAGERAAAVGAGRLVITHLLPGTDPERQRASAAATFGKAVEVAEPGLTFTVGPVPN